jgi:hypothetical protein
MADDTIDSNRYIFRYILSFYFPLIVSVDIQPMDKLSTAHTHLKLDRFRQIYSQKIPHTLGNRMIANFQSALIVRI